ncbi:hypothetical protein [Nocardia sp.]|uniref:hypothetical protein n=1 Tax=Nocardia sp. TaxID=1821 RepID=UPI002609E7DA|nr:hypothetical protein [Nocardia sp.]
MSSIRRAHQRQYAPRLAPEHHDQEVADYSKLIMYPGDAIVLDNSVSKFDALVRAARI